MPEAEDDLALLIRAARQAGEIASGYADRTAKVWHKPDNAGPVTEADFAVNEMLESTLREARPEYGWLSEESPDNPDRLDTNKVFIVDPIDGTRSFVEGSNTWAHSLAIADHGVVKAAVVFLPKRDKLYAARAGAGATLNETPIRPTARHEVTGASVLAARPVMDKRHWKTASPNVQRGYRPSLAYRLALVAEGRFDAMLTLRPTWEWDIAAGALILAESGAMATNRFGKPLIFNNPDPRLDGVVSAGPDLHAQITGALSGDKW